MRRCWAAAAAGLVLMMTGCAQQVEASGDSLYEQAAGQYFPLAEDMHEVIMAVHPGEWAVGTGGYGAVGVSCRLGSGGSGYSLNYVRSVTTEIGDAAGLAATASSAFDALGHDAEVNVRGSGDAEQHVVVAEGERIGRAVVTISPARGEVRVTARTECAPGDAHELTAMVMGGGERIDRDAATRLPATEVPESVPQFYFPADGPVYFDADGTPVEPQPLITEPPVAPYGD